VSMKYNKLDKLWQKGVIKINKDKDRELSPTALNPLVGIDSYTEKIETDAITEQINEE
jgi:hypothetical protein